MITPELTTALLFVAVGGLFLLFARDWTVRVAGGLLIVPRLLAAPLSDGEAIIGGCAIAAAAAHVVFGRSYGPRPPAEPVNEDADPPEEDDTSEPAACVACRAVIPAGASACPACGWSYTAAR